MEAQPIDASPEAKLKILSDDLLLWVNTRFLFENRLQANMRLEKLGLGSADEVASNKKELERCQAMVSFYEEQLTAVRAYSAQTAAELAAKAEVERIERQKSEAAERDAEQAAQEAVRAMTLPDLITVLHSAPNGKAPLSTE